MVIAIIPAVVLVVGLLMWFVSANARVAECGKLMFFAGMLALMFATMSHHVKIG